MAPAAADTSVENGQTVTDWLDQFGPVIAAGTTETEWPESIVVDSTEFQHTNPKTGKAEQLLCVLAAWGYPTGSKTGRRQRRHLRKLRLRQVGLGGRPTTDCVGDGSSGR